MPLELRELIIQAQVESSGTTVGGTAKQQLNPEDREAIIEAVIERLEERLAEITRR